ncbi:hypothetical protein [Hyphomicrobium sp. MC8b]|uniref:hypothetical protein n=1 Tax=Hyphomicrobium sp. MC8b TaxID=300273 RepID=UPI00391A0B02
MRASRFYIVLFCCLAAIAPGRVFASGGTCFKNWTATQSVRDWRGLGSSADGRKLAAAAFGGRIYTSADSGASWSARESNRQWVNVASSSDGVKLAAIDDGGRIYISGDSGATWTARAAKRKWADIASSADGTKLVAAVANSGRLYTSADSGVTWKARASNREWAAVTSSADGTKLAAAVFGGRLYTSSDSGVTWRAAESERNWRYVASSADGTKLAATDHGGFIYTSVDSGVSWTARTGGGARYWNGIAVSDDGGTIVAGVGAVDGRQAGQLYFSRDGGSAWSAREFDRVWTDIVVSADGGTVAAVASGGQLYTSQCAGSGAARCTEDNGGACGVDAERDSGGPQDVAANVGDAGTGQAGCTTIGSVCRDGTVYAGRHPHTQVQLFIPSTNQGTTMQWKTSAGANDIATDSVTDGRVNSDQVANSATFPAFKLCKDLRAGGHSDWYVPSQLEMYHLMVTRAALVAGGKVTDFLDGNYYWTSTEQDNGAVRYQGFPDGNHVSAKNAAIRLRCMRR